MNCGMLVKEARWDEKDSYVLLDQTKVPFGWNKIMYLGCKALKSIAACRLNLVMVTLATHGEGISFASSGPRRKSRVGEWAPSEPTSKFPVSLVPSSKVTVTMLSSVVSTDFKRLPH